MSDHPTELVVFSDDWGRHPSSCQHLVAELLPRYQVHWVNTIGTRLPTLDWYTIQRGAGKIRSWLGPGTAAPESGVSNPRVHEPPMWPSFQSPLGRWINRKSLARTLGRNLATSTRRIGVTTIPLVAEVIDALPVDRWIYYCVDDLSEWPGLDKESLLRMEERLLTQVDDVIAVSDRLVERLASLGRASTLLTHGVDLDHWILPDVDEVAELSGLPRPLVTFWGLVDRRMNVEWLARLSENLTTGTILLVGPENTPDPALDRLPNLRRIGPLPYARLPAVAAASSVLIMPYADLPATRMMQPLKLKEYLATGKPVVTSSLPAADEWRDAADVVETAETFVETVLQRLEWGASPEQFAARRRLQDETWTAKAELFEQVLQATSPAEDRRPAPGIRVATSG